MKNIYIPSKIEVLVFTQSDVITTSGGNVLEDGGFDTDKDVFGV